MADGERQGGLREAFNTNVDLVQTVVNGACCSRVSRTRVARGATLIGCRAVAQLRSHHLRWIGLGCEVQL